MKKIFTTAICFLIITSCIAQPSSGSVGTPYTNTNPPKLVIGIVIDQMRYDFLFRFWNLYGDGGFKRMINNGFLCRDARYNYFLTTTGPGHTTVYTGTTPSIHGIVDNEWYDRTSKSNIYCAADSSTQTVGNDAASSGSSPVHLRTSTVTDELKLVSRQSKVIGIALKDRAAILPAGHAANGAYWYDGSTGRWITSTWYVNKLPSWVSDFNRKKGADDYLNQKWELLLKRRQYTQCTGDSMTFEDPLSNEKLPVFPHRLGKDDYSLLPATPFGNTMTKDMAIAAIKGEQLGKNDVTDFLCISFSSTDIIGHKFGPNSLETADCYARLDRDLEDFFKFLDSYLGMNNVLVFLTADHGVAINPQFAKSNKIDGGILPSGTWKDSINNYLGKFYGSGMWVANSATQQVYLNYDLIDKNKVPHEEIAAHVKDYLLSKQEVLCVVAPEYQQLNDCSPAIQQTIMNGYQQGRSGDILYSVAPGWIDWPSNKGTSHGTAFSYDTHVPLIFYGWRIDAGTSAEPVVIPDIAPTISDWLNISYPSGCTGHPIDAIRLK